MIHACATCASHTHMIVVCEKGSASTLYRCRTRVVLLLGDMRCLYNPSSALNRQASKHPESRKVDEGMFVALSLLHDVTQQPDTQNFLEYVQVLLPPRDREEARHGAIRKPLPQVENGSVRSAFFYIHSSENLLVSMS